MQKIVFIINPISGTASKKSMPALIDKYIDKNRFDIEIKFTEYAGHASVLAKEAREAGVDVVVAVGGDGTVNEIARGLKETKSAFVDAPVIEEFPVCMECELAEIAENESFYCVVGKIVNTAAEEAVLSENGKVDPAKLNALIFDQFQSGYYVSGEKVGKAWNAGAGLMKK